MSILRDVTRALDYPYEPLTVSVTLHDGEPTPFLIEQVEGRHPVLAIGSNRALTQLRRKFPEGDCLPVEQAQLKDYDVVYGARVSGYGAIPATLISSPGTIVDVAVTWLTDVQRDIMDLSEGLGQGYYWFEIPQDRLLGYGGRKLNAVGGYVAARGVWATGVGPVALTGVRAVGRRFTAWDSREALRALRSQFCPNDEFDVFVERLVNDLDFRVDIRRRMGVLALRGSEVPDGTPTR